MWDQRYGEPGFAYGDAPNDYLVEVADRLPVGRALCLAEGEGRNAVFLAQRGFEVTALDQSAVGLSKAEQLAADRGVRIATVVANLEDHEIPPGHWDVIVSIWAHTPPAIRRRTHRQVVAGLRSGGMFVLEAYRPEQVGRGTGGPPIPELTMPLSDLEAELADLNLLHAVAIEREVREGRYHRGLSAVVQVLGRKP